LYITLLPKTRCPNKIFNTFLIEDFFSFALGGLKLQFFRNNSKRPALIEYSEAWEKLVREKN
jgi:hypothetical protein